jgi:NDP-sugar pyrophosphorylase family protein
MQLNLLKHKVIIICGGKGKRLGHITKQTPKPLVKVGKFSIIEHKLNYYKKQGLEDFVFCIGYKGNILKKFLKKKCKKPIFSDGGVSSGILKRIYLARKIINTSAIISYGDTLAKINFRDLLKQHKKSKAILSIVVAPIRNPFGLVNWDQKRKVTQFEEKPTLNHFIGYAVIEPNIFNYLNKNIINLEDGKGMVKAIQKLISKRLVNVYKFKGLQLTVNSLSELKEAKTKIGKYFTFDEVL